MAQRIFIIYTTCIAFALAGALASGAKWPASSGGGMSSGSYFNNTTSGYRGSSGSWGWGGGK